ncbi:hypothetical protein WJX81_007688 [Elliptochloris bilobata]|uniref:histidine--tRNA ligase n=1 Tax=Elliptochloris bilobata TaxID=381761 RepID=A0AAW1S170_9CHLO
MLATRHLTLVGGRWHLRVAASFTAWRPSRKQRYTAAATPAPVVDNEEKGKERKVGLSLAQEAKGGLIDLQPPRGTRDFLPEDLRVRQWLFGEFEAVARLFGFEQFETPVLESEALFTRKAGDEITQQLYNFEDKGGRRVALRPELTPSLARLVLAQAGRAALPLKWFTIGQCWRYERTTRGRRREHYQWNMDIVGVPGVGAEAELLAAVCAFLQRVGLGPADVVIKVSSRGVLSAVLARYAIPAAAVGPVAVVVDKMDKLPLAKVEEELAALGVAADAAAGILAATQAASLPELEALLGPGHEAITELRELFALAEAYGIADYLQFDASCIRGLSYYTGVVFEGRDRAGELRAIFGGGRYDALLSTFGGEAQPCAGFGFGDCVIAELLKERDLLPVPAHQVEDLVVAMDEALRPAAIAAAQRLRRAGRRVDLLLEPKKMKWVFKHAERCGAARLVLLAPEEWAAGAVRVKDLATREEVDVLVADLV